MSVEQNPSVQNAVQQLIAAIRANFERLYNPRNTGPVKIVDDAAAGTSALLGTTVQGISNLKNVAVGAASSAVGAAGSAADTVGSIAKGAVNTISSGIGAADKQVQEMRGSYVPTPYPAPAAAAAGGSRYKRKAKGKRTNNACNRRHNHTRKCKPKRGGFLTASTVGRVVHNIGNAVTPGARLGAERLSRIAQRTRNALNTL
jgi:hypothetical protein